MNTKYLTSLVEELLYWRGMAAMSGYPSDIEYQYRLEDALTGYCADWSLDPDTIVAMVKSGRRHGFKLTCDVVNQTCGLYLSMW